MRIGLDMDGTITANPPFFALLSHCIAKGGGKIFVITYRGKALRELTKQQLDGWRILYHGLYLAPGNIEAAPWKAEIAKGLGLDVMFDDDETNLLAMPPRVTGFLVKEDQPALAGLSPYSLLGLGLGFDGRPGTPR